MIRLSYRYINPVLFFGLLLGMFFIPDNVQDYYFEGIVSSMIIFGVLMGIYTAESQDETVKQFRARIFFCEVMLAVALFNFNSDIRKTPYNYLTIVLIKLIILSIIVGFYGISSRVQIWFKKSIITFLLVAIPGILLFGGFLGTGFLSRYSFIYKVCFFIISLFLFPGIYEFIKHFLSQPLSWLFWKEIREQLIPFIIMFGILAVMVLVLGLDVAFGGLASALLVLYAAFLGSRSFAKEDEDKTISMVYSSPIHPRSYFFNKYFTGLMPLFSLYYLVMVSVTENKSIPLYNSYFPFLLGGIYSLSLCYSIFIKDSLRSALAGVGTTVVLGTILKMGYGRIYVYFEKNIDRYILDYFTNIYMILFMVILFSVCGVIYYSRYWHRFEWKNGFSLVIPLTLCFGYFYTSNTMTSTLVPVYKYKSDSFDHYYNAMIYQGERLYILDKEYAIPQKDSSPDVFQYPLKDTIKVLDVTNSKSLKLLSEYIPQNKSAVFSKMIISGTHLWFVESYKTRSLPGAKEWVYPSFISQGQIKAFRILPDGKLQVEKTEELSNYRDPYLYSDNSTVIITYSKLTMAPEELTKLPRLKERDGFEKHYLIYNSRTLEKTGNMTKKDPALPGILLNQLVHYKDFVLVDFLYGIPFVYKDKNGEKLRYVNDFREGKVKYVGSALLDYKRLLFAEGFYPTVVRRYAVQGDYLYLCSEDDLLEVFDLRTLPQISKVYTVPRKGLDILNNNRSYSTVFNGYQLYASKDRLILGYERGFILYDISTPDRPKEIGRIFINTRAPITMGKNSFFMAPSMGGAMEVYSLEK